jgi:hypothetical protein
MFLKVLIFLIRQFWWFCKESGEGMVGIIGSLKLEKK